MAQRILIVDDQEMVRGLLRRALELEGYAVSEAESGELALEVLAGSDVRLVISDAHMPGMGGLELLKRVKTCHPGVRVIILTGHTGEHDVTRFLVAGADEYLPKPFAPGHLVGVVGRLLAATDGGPAGGT